MPLRASSAVLALAYTAIFMPRKPDTMDVVAPSKKETVENTPLYRAGAWPAFQSRENPSWLLSSTKMRPAKKTCSRGGQCCYVMSCRMVEWNCTGRPSCTGLLLS